MAKSIFCPECDHEHEGVLVRGEFEDYHDFPEECENCGHSLDGGEPDAREDFHADI